MKDIEKMQLYQADHVKQTVDHRNNDYVTTFHFDGRLCDNSEFNNPVGNWFTSFPVYRLTTLNVTAYTNARQGSVQERLTTVMLTASSNCCMNMLTEADASNSRINGSLNCIHT